jgi:hypothetical protein
MRPNATGIIPGGGKGNVSAALAGAAVRRLPSVTSSRPFGGSDSCGVTPRKVSGARPHSSPSRTAHPLLRGAPGGGKWLWTGGNSSIPLWAVRGPVTINLRGPDGLEVATAAALRRGRSSCPPDDRGESPPRRRRCRHVEVSNLGRRGLGFRPPGGSDNCGVTPRKVVARPRERLKAPPQVALPSAMPTGGKWLGRAETLLLSYSARTSRRNTVSSRYSDAPCSSSARRRSSGSVGSRSAARVSSNCSSVAGADQHAVTPGWASEKR